MFSQYTDIMDSKRDDTRKDLMSAGYKEMSLFENSPLY